MAAKPRLTPAHVAEFTAPHLAGVFTQAAKWAAEHDDGIMTVIALDLSYDSDDDTHKEAVILNVVYDGAGLSPYHPDWPGYYKRHLAARSREGE